MSILCQIAFAKLQDYQISIQTVKASRACFWQGFPDNAIDRTKQKKLPSSNGSVPLLKTMREPLQNTAKEIKLCSRGSDFQTQTMTGRVSSQGTQSDTLKTNHASLKSSKQMLLGIYHLRFTKEVREPVKNVLADFVC